MKHLSGYTEMLVLFLDLKLTLRSLNRGQDIILCVNYSFYLGISIALFLIIES